MTARIAGFVSRVDAGLRAPRSVSHSIAPARGGTALHWGGAGAAPGTHAGCIARWKAWQDFHMDDRGWVDIAYTGGFCQHGHAFAGRGFGNRTAGQGTNDGNDRFYAAVWIGGSGSTPTAAALDAAEWWVGKAQRDGDAGRECRPHRYFHTTDCPGPALVELAARLHGRAVLLPTKGSPPVASASLQRADIDAIWNADRISVTDPSLTGADGKNLTWQADNALGRVLDRVTQIRRELLAVAKVVETQGKLAVTFDAQLDRIEESSATGGVDLDALADAVAVRLGDRIAAQVADLLAARLSA